MCAERDLFVRPLLILSQNSCRHRGWLTDTMTDRADTDQMWSDRHSSISDIHGRAEFAKVVSSRIAKCALGQESTVFGLVGPWGSGKSTLLNEVRAHLTDWKIVDFSPWSASDSAVLTSEFVATLSAAFPKAKTLGKRLVKYSRYGTPALSLIPAFGGAASRLAETLMSDLAARPPWQTEFNELSKEIEAQGARVLVVVDDVDRLDTDELRSLFRVVRLLGRFTNVHYLLAYDQSTIEKLLSQSNSGGHSSDYTEKIVQYPFELPPVPKVVRRAWARDIVGNLDAVDGDGPNRPEYLDQREQLVSILTNALETPRAARRLREQVVSLGALAQGAEVDILDFIALTWIRITHHRLWDHIRLHRDEYLGWQSRDSSDIESEHDALVASLVERGEPDSAQRAVRFLFGSFELTAAFAKREWRMHHARFFERYFLVGVSQDDVSDLMIGRALEMLESNKQDTLEVKQLESILSGLDQDRAALALESINSFPWTRAITSTGVLCFIEKARATLVATPMATDARISGLDRWLNREIFRALRDGVAPISDLVEHYGYEQMTYGAYFARRSLRVGDDEVRAVYLEMATNWLAEIRGSDLVEILNRTELIPMTSFLIWIEELISHRGFLSSQVHDSETIMKIAQKFVSFNEWVGAGVHYEVTFREQEFRFAVDVALTQSVLQNLPPRVSIPDYEISDLPGRNLTDLQRRDFALRHLAQLEVDDEGRADPLS